MFIAHLPSGYLLSSLLLKRTRLLSISTRTIMLAGIIGAVAPDFDMLYFYLVDNRQTHHHRYFAHWPILWFGLTLLCLLWRRFAPASERAIAVLVFSLGGMLHLLLDTFVGDIWWLAPFVDQPFALFSVPAVFKPWWLNFILHWSFAVELAIWLWAWLMYRRRVNSLVFVNHG
jgi:hypothetical protein